MGFRLAALLLALFTMRLAAQTVCPPTPAYSPCEIVFPLSEADQKQHPNPFASVELRAEFRSPRHRTYLMPSYWDGAGRVVIRFSPNEVGEWDFRVTSNLAAYTGKTGTFTATASEAPGFIRTANVHHFAYTENLLPHLWMGHALTRFQFLDAPAFRKIIDTRADEKFSHIAGSLLGEGDDIRKAFPATDRPDLAYFQHLDECVRYIHQKGLTADLAIAGSLDAITRTFSDWQQRERLVRYLVARYAAFNITWQGVEHFENSANARDLLKELGLALKKIDPYQHIRSTGTVASSAGFADDGWMDYITHHASDPAIGAIEHQLYPSAFVNTGPAAPGADGESFRHGLWNAAMNGQYISGNSDPAAARPDMKAFYEFFAKTRHWELEPYFDVDGGRALALDDVEYIVYVEKPGPVEITVEKHGYDVVWFNPANGESIKMKDFKGERFAGEPPDRQHDWVLHISREGHKESMRKSYKFDSRRILMQEIELNPQKVPFDAAEPAGDAISLAAPLAFTAKLKRETHATRSMLYLWTAEVVADNQGSRVLGTGPKGTFRIPPEIAAHFPAVLHVRLAGMNANGKAYTLDRTYQLTQ
jgi:hypothetical protein